MIIKIIFTFLFIINIASTIDDIDKERKPVSKKVAIANLFFSLFFILLIWLIK